MNIASFFKNTPLEIFVNGIKKLNHELSNAFRFVAMWKYGGTYLDLDMIVTKPLDDLPYNSVCVESYRRNQINSAYMKMDRKKGRIFAEMLLK